MCMGNSHTCENYKDSEVTLGIYDIFDKGEKSVKKGAKFQPQVGKTLVPFNRKAGRSHGDTISSI